MGTGRHPRLASRMPKGRLGDPLEDIGRPLVSLVLDADRCNGRTIAINAQGVFDTIETIEEVPFRGREDT